MPFLIDHNLLFVHIPKTGGSSIERKFGLDTFNHPRDLCYSWTEEDYNGTIFSPQHFTPNMIKERYYDDFIKSKKFTIVRNPYTKVISEYFYRNNTYNMNMFDDFMSKFFIKRTDHSLPQHLYFENIDYDYVLKFENLNDEFRLMSENFDFDGSLPHWNKSRTGKSSSDFIKEISTKSIDIINKEYEKDFTLLNYNFI